MARRTSPRFETDVNKDNETELKRLEHRLVHGGADAEAGEVQVAGGGAVDVQAEEADSSGGESLVAVDGDAQSKGVVGVVVQGAVQRREQLEEARQPEYQARIRDFRSARHLKRRRRANNKRVGAALHMAMPMGPRGLLARGRCHRAVRRRLGRRDGGKRARDERGRRRRHAT